MSIKVNSQEINSIKQGTSPISEVRTQNTKVWPAGPSKVVFDNWISIYYKTNPQTEIVLPTPIPLLEDNPYKIVFPRTINYPSLLQQIVFNMRETGSAANTVEKELYSVQMLLAPGTLSSLGLGMLYFMMSTIFFYTKASFTPQTSGNICSSPYTNSYDVFKDLYNGSSLVGTPTIPLITSFDQEINYNTSTVYNFLKLNNVVSIPSHLTHLYLDISTKRQKDPANISNHTLCYAPGLNNGNTENIPQLRLKITSTY